MQQQSSKLICCGSNFFQIPHYSGECVACWPSFGPGDSVAAQPGALPSHHYRAHPRTECLYQDPFLPGSRFTLRSGNRFIWSRSRKSMRWRPSLPAPSLPKSFLPLSVSSPAVQYRRRSGEPPTSSFSMHSLLAFCWVMDHWVGRRQAGDPASRLE